MSILDVIKTRRSIRKFEEKEIGEDQLNQVLEAVQWSPSWANTQVWEVVIVKDAGVKERLSGTLTPKNPAARAVAQAPVVLVLCAKLKTSGFYKNEATTALGDWFMFDLGLAVQSLCLAAHDAGLGSVIVGAFDIGAVEKILEVPQGYRVVSMIPLGRPRQQPPVPKRRDISDFTHWDKF